MSNAGNLDEPARAERPSAEAASRKPGAGSTDRPGADLGGAGDLSRPQGPASGSRSNPDPTGSGPHSGLADSTSPTLTDQADRDLRTPGQGSLPDRPQGEEVDPGLG